MGAYIHHAAYYVNDIDWYLSFFKEVFDMDLTRQRLSGGLREVWLSGGLQLCEAPEPQNQDGRCAHLCLITDDVEASRERALSLGCTPMDKHHWVKLPDGLALELFQAAPGAVAHLKEFPSRAK